MKGKGRIFLPFIAIVTQCYCEIWEFASINNYHCCAFAQQAGVKSDVTASAAVSSPLRVDISAR
jgi:hypothetical protein